MGGGVCCRRIAAASGRAIHSGVHLPTDGEAGREAALLSAGRRNYRHSGDAPCVADSATDRMTRRQNASHEVLFFPKRGFANKRLPA